MTFFVGWSILAATVLTKFQITPSKMLGQWPRVGRKQCWDVGIVERLRAQVHRRANHPLVFILHVINYFSRTWAPVMLQVYPSC